MRPSRRRRECPRLTEPNERPFLSAQANNQHSAPLLHLPVPYTRSSCIAYVEVLYYCSLQRLASDASDTRMIDIGGCVVTDETAREARHPIKATLIQGVPLDRK